jgi:hypothetical protein
LNLIAYFSTGITPDEPAMNRKIPLWFVLLLLWFSFIGALAFGWDVWRIKTSRQGAHTSADRAIIAIASSPSLLKESFKEIGQGSKLISHDYYPAIKGFEADNKFTDDGYILLATYSKSKDQSVVKLVRIADQKIIYEWTPDYNAIMKQVGSQNKAWTAQAKHDLRLYRPLLLPDGSLIFTNLLSPLIKIDKNSGLVWAVDGIYHHAIELDAEGNIWVPSVIAPSPFFSNILTQFKDDAITELSPGGKILLKRSVAQIFTDNGYQALLLGVGAYERDLLHVNGIQPAPATGKYWMKGDLLISARNRSTVFLYRPSTNKILWLQTGPWLNQHDAHFMGDTAISVFGNDMVRVFGDERLVNGFNDEYIFNFNTGKTSRPYTQFLKSAKVRTTNEGRAEILQNGDLFVEETNENRILRGNSNNTVWQYVDRIDEHSLAALSCSSYISKDEFSKLTFLNKKQ